MSMLKGKAGFVIPKNKFSGSLVPIFKKSESIDAPSEESSKHQQRKTKWGADLTQDTTVKRGRALAYQTRVDQITQQLKLGLTKSDNENSNPTTNVQDSELASMQVKLEKFQCMDLERREAIGEILKLNPGYKTPPDYEPVLREATIPIPVKAYPGYNFLGLVYVSDGETQNRLEKDTGTRIQVYGIIGETGKKVEITPSDGSEVLRVCEEAYVQISADTYDKVDAAAGLIELLLNSVSVRPAESETVVSVSGDDTQVLGDGQGMATAINTAMASHEIMQPNTGPISFQPFSNPWFPAGQSNSPSGVLPVPSSGPLAFSPAFQRPSFGPGPHAPYFGSSPQSTSIMPPRLQSPAPNLQGVPSAYHVGHTGPPRSLSAATSSPFIGHQSSMAGSPRFGAPQLAERPLMPTASSPGWPAPASGAPQSLASPASQVRPSATSFVPSQIRSSVPFQSFAPQIQLNLSRPSQFPVPRPSGSPVPQFGMPNIGHAYGPSFTPLNPTGHTAPGPQRDAGDFTFKPHLPQGPPSHSLPGPGAHFASQRPSQGQFPPVPQMPSFRPALQNSVQQPVRQSFPRPSVGNQMGPSPVHFGAPNQNPHMGIRNHGQAPQFPNVAGSVPPRAGPSAPFQPSQSPGGIFGGNQHSEHSGRPQVYDPFLPSSLPGNQPPQIGNNGIARKQESDPEYEDLMASVGVK